MTSRVRLVALFIVVALIALGVQTPRTTRADAGPTMTLNSAIAASGDPAIVTLVLARAPAPGITGYGFEIDYDSGSLTLMNHTNVCQFSLTGPGVGPTSSPGSYFAGCTNRPTGPPVAACSPGPCVLATLTFTCNAIGTFPLTLVTLDNGYGDAQGHLATPDFVSGSIQCLDLTLPGLWQLQTDDTFPSMGTFKLWITPKFRPLIASCVGYSPATFELQSPTLNDSLTRVGRGGPIVEGSPGDATTGVLTGISNTMIDDTMMPVQLAGSEANPGVKREVHTELHTLNLTGSLGSYVRAGNALTAFPVPISAGEVESQDPTGNPMHDFPASSFFDVFVEVNLPRAACGGGAAPDLILHNSTTPLLVDNGTIISFPPKTIYLHGNTTAVPVYFANSSAGEWAAGNRLGWLVLAGHGANYDFNNDADVAQFNAFMNAVADLPVPLGCIFDLDNNGKVGFPDLLVFAVAYNSVPSSPNWNPAADFDGNAKVGFPDLLQFATHYNQIVSCQ